MLKQNLKLFFNHYLTLADLKLMFESVLALNSVMPFDYSMYVVKSLSAHILDI